MASVDFKKVKTLQEVRNMVKHCDVEQRLRSDHANKHIDKSRTNLNKQFKNSSLEQTMQKFKDKLSELDAVPGANKRKDRVIAFMLEVPIPAGIPNDKAVEFSNKVNKLINEQYGKGCIINGYIHFDEGHTYIDAETGKERESLNHIHLLVIPAVDGRLNGKVFSKKANMVKLNKAIDAVCKNDYGVSFLTGASKKSREEVETLKLKSDKAELERRTASFEADYEIKISHVAKHKEENKQKEKELKAREEALKLKEQELNEKIELFNKLNVSLQGIRRKIKAEDQKRIDDAVQMARDAVPSMVAEPTRANDDIPDFVKD